MKENEQNPKPNQNSDNNTPSNPKKDPIKERLKEMKNTYEQMIKLRKDNLDPFKKIDMSTSKNNK